MLRDLNVDVKLQTKIIRSSRTKREGPNQFEISLSDGTTLSADLYIPTSGIVPNSSYIPDKHLNANGFVKVDEFFQVKGLENQHVWAIGDVNDLESPQLMVVDRQSGHLAKNIVLMLNNKAALPYKEGIRGKFTCPDDCHNMIHSADVGESRYGMPNWQKRRYWTFGLG